MPGYEQGIVMLLWGSPTSHANQQRGGGGGGGGIFVSVDFSLRYFVTTEIIELWKEAKPFWKAKTIDLLFKYKQYNILKLSCVGDNVCEKSKNKIKIKHVSSLTIFSMLKNQMENILQLNKQ